MNKATLLFTILSGISTLVFGQKKETVFKKISIDSLVIITPIVDAAIRNSDFENISDPLLNKEVAHNVQEHLKNRLKIMYVEVDALKNITQSQYIHITHSFLARAQSNRYKKLFDAPDLTIIDAQKYSLLISISGYHGTGKSLGIFANLTIIDNEIKKIICTDHEDHPKYSIDNEGQTIKIIDVLINRYLKFISPSPLKP